MTPMGNHGVKAINLQKIIEESGALSENSSETDNSLALQDQ